MWAQGIKRRVSFVVKLVIYVVFAGLAGAIARDIAIGPANTPKPVAVHRDAAPAVRPTTAHQQAIAVLEKIHPGWRAVTASAPYKQWLASQPALYQQLVNNTWNPLVVETSIDRFLATQRRERKDVDYHAGTLG